jgi:RNA polymerase sigma-70 factor (ECF subfamily)
LVRQAIAMPQMKSNIEQDFFMLQCQVAEGDTRAFRQIFDALFSKLSKFSFSFVQSKEAATEIVDELFVRLWTNKTQIIKINDLRVYLYTATKNASLNYIAKKAKQIKSDLN